jgi:hypothetical protein
LVSLPPPPVSLLTALAPSDIRPVRMLSTSADEWDEKITTFPGLYLVGLAYSRVIEAGAAVLGSPLARCEVGTVPRVAAFARHWAD